MNKLEQIKELLYTGQRSAISTKDFEAIIEQLETAQARVGELEETISDFISDNKSMYSYDDSRPVTLEELQTCIEFTYYACLSYEQAFDEINDFLNWFCNICPNDDNDSFDYCNNGCLLDAIAHPIEDIIKSAKDINVPHKKEGE